jgi:hypothetical protein
MTTIDFKKIALAHMSDPELMGINFYLVKITPALAKDMLTANAVGQRNPSAATIDRYEADIAVGAWKFAGDPIRYNAAGNLIDGQHRLAAISAGEEDVVNMVITGLDPDVMSAIDTGRRRSLPDLLRIEQPDIKYPKTIATILARLWYHEVANCYFVKGVARAAAPSELNSATPSFAQLIDTMHRWQAKVGTSLEQAAKWGHMAYGTNPGITPPTFGTVYMLLSGFDKDVREVIFHELVYEPRTTSSGYPVNALRARLLRLNSNANERWSPQVQHHFLGLIVNAMMSGDEINTMRTPPNLAFPYLTELKFHPEARKHMGVDEQVHQTVVDDEQAVEVA